MLSLAVVLISWSTTHLKDKALWQKTTRRLDLRSTELVDHPLIAMNIVAINWNLVRARVFLGVSSKKSASKIVALGYTRFL